MDREFEKLIEAIVSDGVVTDKEKTVLYKAADRLGVDRDTANVLLEAALHNTRENLTSSNSGATESNQVSKPKTDCEKCGAPIEPVLSNCLFCKAPIRGIDPNSIDTDELIMKASEWVGKISDGVLRLTAPDANEWLGRGVKTMQKGEISGMAAKYLNLLEVRAQNNPNLRPVVSRLQADYESQKKSLSPQHKNMINLLGFFLVFILLMTFWSSGESNKEESALHEMTQQEDLIQEAIAEENFSRAKSLAIQLDWPDAASSTSENARFSEKYNQKRTYYLEMIEKMESQTE